MDELSHKKANDLPIEIGSKVSEIMRLGFGIDYFKHIKHDELKLSNIKLSVIEILKDL